VDLDVLTVLRFAQAFSIEADPALLLRKMIESILQTACASRAVLVLRAKDVGVDGTTLDPSSAIVTPAAPATAGLEDDAAASVTTSAAARAAVATVTPCGDGPLAQPSTTENVWNVELTAYVQEEVEGATTATHAASGPSSKHGSSAHAGTVRVAFGDGAPLGMHIPLRVLHYVVNSSESLTLSEPTRLAADSPFCVLATDEYFSAQQRAPRALFCLPILKHGQVSGVLYLESYTNSGAFHAAPKLLLQLLCSQAALNLTNSRLYARLSQSHASLEGVVRARTAELQQRNQQLETEMEVRKQAQQSMLKAKLEAEAAARSKADFLSNMRYAAHRGSRDIRAAPAHGS